MLPSHVRVFWALSVAIVAYWTLRAEWYVTFPSEHYQALLLKLPPPLREPTRRMDIILPMAGRTFWGVVILGTAWFAAFRKQNWARWAFAFVFLFGELLPCIVLAYVYLMPVYSDLYRHNLAEMLWRDALHEWANPRSYIVPALAIAAIVAVFTGNANDWFRRPAGEQRGT